MTTEIVGALIAGAFAIVSPIAALIVKDYLENLAKQPMSSGRRQAISGRWKGRVSQPHGPNDTPTAFDVVFDLKAGRRTISGVMTITHRETTMPSPLHFDVQGGFYYGRFLRLDYTPKDEAAIQFGSIIFELDAMGRELVGTFVGYGAFTQNIVTGGGTFSKMA